MEAYWRSCAIGSSGLAGDERYAGGGRALDRPCGSVLYEPELGLAMLILDDMIRAKGKYVAQTLSARWLAAFNARLLLRHSGIHTRLASKS